MTRTTAAAVVILAAALRFGAAPAAAQEPVKSFSALNTRLKPGDTVWVTDAQGRELTGRIRDLSPTSLLLDADGAPHDIQAAGVRTIRVQPKDPLGNGTLWGTITGSVGGALSCVANPQCIGDDGGGGITAILAVMGAAAGAGIGAAVDAAVKGPKLVVYAVPAVPGGGRLSLAPMITPRAKGVAVSFGF